MKYLFSGLNVPKKSLTLTLQVEQAVQNQFSMKADADALAPYEERLSEARAVCDSVISLLLRLEDRLFGLCFLVSVLGS